MPRSGVLARTSKLLSYRKYTTVVLMSYRPLLAETFTDIEKFRGTC